MQVTNAQARLSIAAPAGPRRRARTLGSVALGVAFAAALWGPASAEPAGPGFDIQSVDRSVRPGDDFYTFANGAWIRTTTPPAGQSAYGTSAMLVEKTRLRVRGLIQDASAAKSARPGAERRVGDYYASLMDQAGIEAKGLVPLHDDLAAIDAIHDRTSLSAHLGSALRADIDGAVQTTEGLFGLWVHQSFSDGDHNYAQLLQGGLGLSDRDDYLDPSPKAAAFRTRYQAHIAAVLKLAGVSDAEARAARIFALETAIARTHASQADAGDPAKTDNPWKRADFERKAPGMDWGAYFKAARLDRQGVIVVWEPSAVTGISALAVGEPLETWKDYLRFRLIEHAQGALPKAYGEEHAALFGGATDRSQRAIDATNAALGEAVGRLYVERHFPPQAKAEARAMVDNLILAYRARIPNLTWMSPETRQKALTKLATLKVELGYPDTWIDYSRLAIVRGDAYGNLRRIERFNYARSLAQLDRPAETKEWAIAPQTVSAVILFSPNTMDFAAGVLQPPYFDPEGDRAANYGSAGAGIAHEISHSFDELGDQYDDKGRFVVWWTPDDVARFRTAQTRLIAQFDAYCPQADLCLHGKQLVSENTADLTGLSIAHDAYIRSLNGRPDVVKEGLTGEQRFFLAFGQRWRKLQGDAALRQQILTDTHAPGVFRSDTVRNLDAWYDAYGVKPGDKLYLAPAERVRIW